MPVSSLFDCYEREANDISLTNEVCSWSILSLLFALNKNRPALYAFLIMIFTIWFEHEGFSVSSKQMPFIMIVRAELNIFKQKFSYAQAHEINCEM